MPQQMVLNLVSSKGIIIIIIRQFHSSGILKDFYDQM